VGNREDASSMVTAGGTANATEENSRASRESGLLCSHSHGESIVGMVDIAIRIRLDYRVQPQYRGGDCTWFETRRFAEG